MPVEYVVRFDKNTCRGYVDDKRLIEQFEKKWYGVRDGERLVLDIVEIAYLLLKGKTMIVEDSNIIKSFDDFLKNYYSCLETFFWPRLIVYKDLRDRGRRVKIMDIDKFIVRDKYGDLRLVIVLEEGNTKEVSSIKQHIETALDHNLKLVYAIVSLQGDLTYYEVTKADLKRD